MKTWEIDVEMRVRRTLVIHGPTTEDPVRRLAELLLRAGQAQGFIPAVVLKWEDGRSDHRPMPIEAIIDNDPQIVAVREVP